MTYDMGKDGERDFVIKRNKVNGGKATDMHGKKLKTLLRMV